MQHDFRAIVRKAYDLIGEDYHRYRVRFEAEAAKWLEVERSMLPPNARILDLGCGGGRPVLKFFADRGCSVTGVDLSPRMIEIARQSVPSANLHCMDFTQLDLTGQKFNFIISLFAFDHIDRNFHFQTIARIKQHLEPGAGFLATFGETDNPGSLELNKDGIPLYRSSYGLEQYLAFYQQLEFTVTETRRIEGEKRNYSVIRATI